MTPLKYPVILFSISWFSFTILASLFLLLSPLPDKQPTPNYFFTIGSSFPTSIAQLVFLTLFLTQVISAPYPITDGVTRALLVLPKVPKLPFMEVWPSPTWLPLNPLWNPTIPHGAIGNSCQVLSSLSVTSSNFSRHSRQFLPSAQSAEPEARTRAVARSPSSPGCFHWWGWFTSTHLGLQGL